MNQNLVQCRFFGVPFKISLFVLLGIFFNQCTLEPEELAKDPSDMVMTDYVYNNPDDFSEFGDVLKATGVENVLRVRGPYTLFLPTNDAMRSFYEKNGKDSYDDFSIDFLTDLAYNHILKGEVSSTTIGPGALPYQNALNDNVASDLQGVEIVINKQSTIIKRDIKVANGYIHHVDSVLDLVNKTVYEVLKDDGGYSIFVAGLEECGFTDTLNLIAIPYGKSNPRVFYTIMAVPDTLYQREGVNNLNDLIAKYDTDGSHKSDTNGFFQYMENHCLSGSYYFTSFNKNKTIFYLMTQNSYLQIIDEDRVFKINKGTDNTYTEFYYEPSNFPAKNGCIHAVNTQLPVTNTKPIEVLYQVTHQFDMQQGEYYLKYYERFYDGQNDFAGIKWDGDYLLYYCNPGVYFLEKDGLNVISNGYFWIEVTTPKIRKGFYKLSSNHFGHSDAVTKCLNVYVDGVYISSIASQWSTLQDIGPIYFSETKEHTIRMESAVSTLLFWDYVLFTPI